MRPVSIDTRTIKQGDLYLPIKGQRFDGHDFINDALAKGASILDVDLPTYAKKYRKKLKCPVIAITGSAGKTTIKDMLTAIFQQKMEVVSTYQNQNNEIGAPLTLIQADNQTGMVIVECGMRKKGDLRYLAKLICPTHVIITNIGLTHREFFNSQREIAQAKAELFQSPLKWQVQPRTAFINYGTAYNELLVKTAKAKKFNVLPTVTTPTDGVEQNIATCFAVARYFGWTDLEIQAGLKAFESSDNRLKTHQARGATIINDTYNCNPSGLKFALDALSRLSGRKLAVIGDMLELGEETNTEHQKIGNLCQEMGIDMCLGLGPVMEQQQFDQVPYVHFKSKTELAYFLKAEIKTGDRVLIKGSRGLQMETLVEELINE